jgi:hypothetical protein
MEYYNGALVISGSELIQSPDNPDGIIPKSSYDKLKQRGKLKIARRGCKGTPALIEYNSLPSDLRKRVDQNLGNPYQNPSVDHFVASIKPDPDAARFFSEYRLDPTPKFPIGRPLPAETQAEYYNNAVVLNALNEKIKDVIRRRKASGGKTTGIWTMALQLTVNAHVKYPHNLPTNELRLKEKLNTYLSDGYQSLISGKFQNNNARKTNDDLEQLLLSLFSMPQKPFIDEVYQMYMKFLVGVLDVVDTRTGELFDPKKFRDEEGTPMVVSLSTVKNILREPLNKALVEKKRNDADYFKQKHAPHAMRTSPVYALSKVSLDDRDIPLKMANGQRVKAYYAFDVASGAIVGYAFSREKNTALVTSCFTNMMRNLDKLGIGIPLELEVEHHLMEQFTETLLRENAIFKHVRFCAAGNSQEKRAEHFNKKFKYGSERKHMDGMIKRFYAKSEAYRPAKIEKVFDEKNNTYKFKAETYEDIISQELAAIEAYNNETVGDTGLTRIQYLSQRVNKQAMASYDRALLAKLIGEKVNCSIVRSQYVRARHTQYVLPSPRVISSLQPNNYEVTAYWLEYEDTNQVYLYQGDTFICAAKKVARFNEAIVERTEEDMTAFKDQMAYIGDFKEMMAEKSGKLSKVKTFEYSPTILNQKVETVEIPDEPVEIFQTWDYSPEEMKRRALNQL